MVKEFKAFILRGNAVDLAVGVVMAGAFGVFVNSIVSNLLTPLTTIACTPDPKTKQCSAFRDLSFTLGNSVFKYGEVLNALISLMLIGAAVFFLVVRPLNHLEERRKRQEPEPESPTRPCPECLSEIPKEARRCAHCTVELTASA
ncbi:MAG: large conductance mechanosensitive channel protein MscL [Actinomycetota bacterium]